MSLVPVPRIAWKQNINISNETTTTTTVFAKLVYNHNQSTLQWSVKSILKLIELQKPNNIDQSEKNDQSSFDRPDTNTIYTEEHTKESIEQRNNSDKGIRMAGIYMLFVICLYVYHSNTVRCVKTVDISINTTYEREKKTQ